MLTVNDSFTPPADEHTVLWRYVNLFKFLSLITSSKLTFVRADLLGDEWEGSLTAAMIEARAREVQRIDDLPPAPIKAYPATADLRRRMREMAYISCWRMSPSEDAAMWKVYGDQGIALKTTYTKLVSGITSDVPFMAGAVRYVDFESESYETGLDIFTPLLHKRLEFKYEQELRLAAASDFETSDLITWTDSTGGTSWEYRARPTLSLAIDLNVVVTEVVLAPTMPAWCFPPLRTTLDQNGLKLVPLMKSRLGEAPSF